MGIKGNLMGIDGNQRESDGITSGISITNLHPVGDQAGIAIASGGHALRPEASQLSQPHRRHMEMAT